MSGPATSSTSVTEPVSTSGSVPVEALPTAPKDKDLTSNTENATNGGDSASQEQQSNDVSPTNAWESPRQVRFILSMFAFLYYL